MDDLKIYQTIQKHLALKQNIILATVVEALGSTPRREGAKMLLLPDGKFLGTVGGGCIEETVKRVALNVMENGKDCCTVQVDLVAEPGQKNMDVCGGIMKIMLERF